MAQDTATPPVAPSGAPDPTPLTDRPFLVLVVVLSATFMQLLDISIVNVATPSIQASLHATYSDVQLVLAGYQLAFACTLITGGRLGDRFGRRRLFLLGMAGFTLTSALCGAAVSADMLIVSRVAQGLFSGLMFPQVLSVIQVLFAPKDRGRAFGIFGATIGLGTIMGPVTGGLLIQAAIFHDAWRAIFYVNVPIGIIALIGAALKLPESRAPQASRIDVPGALLVAAGLGLLIYPLTEGRTRGWPLWLIAMLVVSVPLLALFAVVQRRKTRADRSPLLDTGLFADRSFRVGALLSLVFFAGVPPFFFTFSIYLQLGEGFSALGSGLTSFAFAVGSAGASARSNAITQVLGRRVLSLGCGLLVTGMLLVIGTVHLVGAQPHTYQFIPAMLVSGLGLGLFIGPVSAQILQGVTPRRIGSASGAISTVQQVGGAIGTAVIGIIFFGLIGVNAPTAVGETEADLGRALTAAGVPAPAVPTALAGFRSCYTTRAKAADPQQVPAACAALASQRLPGVTPEAGQRVSRLLQAAGRPGSETQRRTFSRSIQETLLYEVGIFAVAGLAVLALPGGPADRRTQRDEQRAADEERAADERPGPEARASAARAEPGGA